MTEPPREPDVSDGQARRTALLVAAVLLAVAAWNLHRGRMTVVYAAGLAALALLVVGLLLPSVARRFHVLWMRVAAALGWVNSRILLSLMYYLVFTPYGLISRLFGRDPLDRRAPRRESYWTPRAKTRQEREQFERLF